MATKNPDPITDERAFLMALRRSLLREVGRIEKRLAGLPTPEGSPPALRPRHLRGWHDRSRAERRGAGR